MLHVPFENLDIHERRVIVLDEDALFEKVVRRRRGGFCYELNGLFAAVLRRIGFDLDLLSAQVASGDGGFGPDFDHLAILVRVYGEGWLADVGFGDSFIEPLRLDDGVLQEQTHGAYQLERDGAHHLALRRRDGHREPMYRFDLAPRRLGDFAEMCRFHQTSPESHFTQKRICTLATESGRVTLSDMRLIRLQGGVRTERELGSEDQWRRTLVDVFGLTPPSAGLSFGSGAARAPGSADHSIP
jgi:N-hydroxyarylamine O-acetyltransferase